MKIFEFINSKDVREHLEKLNYQFTTPEAATLFIKARKRHLRISLQCGEKSSKQCLIAVWQKDRI